MQPSGMAFFHHSICCIRVYMWTCLFLLTQGEPGLNQVPSVSKEAALQYLLSHCCANDGYSNSLPTIAYTMSKVLYGGVLYSEWCVISDTSCRPEAQIGSNVHQEQSFCNLGIEGGCQVCRY